jgi:hypothetical protein
MDESVGTAAGAAAAAAVTAGFSSIRLAVDDAKDRPVVRRPAVLTNGKDRTAISAAWKRIIANNFISLCFDDVAPHATLGSKAAAICFQFRYAMNGVWGFVKHDPMARKLRRNKPIKQILDDHTSIIQGKMYIIITQIMNIFASAFPGRRGSSLDVDDRPWLVVAF